jgi:hypothetical protein
MPERRDIVDKVEIAGIAPPAPRADSASAPTSDADAAGGGAKPFLMIWFRCCSTYARLPKSSDGLRYEGRCPKCLAHLEVPIGEGGSKRRMFEAS